MPGTETGAASVEVQNRIKRVEARLPRAVIQQGILVEEASSAVLQIITLRSTDGSLDEVGLGDFMIRNVLGEIRRIPGVGRATLYSTERSLAHLDRSGQAGRLRPHRRRRQQGDRGAECAGRLGQHRRRAEHGRRRRFRRWCWSRASCPRRTNSAPSSCAPIRTARPCGCATSPGIEIGGLSYQFNTRLNGKPTAGLSVLLSPTGNALATASAVEAKMKELSRFFPANIAYDIPYNITPVVKASIEKVLSTLVEAVVLVFIVMFLFLQNIRYTIIPTIVVPVALLGTCATLMLAGYSINMLTMFGMVLAVGILVDDAIVVVENVERIMAEEGLPPKEATRKAMSQITGRHHRHHAGADGGVRADGVLPGLGRHHLPPVLGHHGRRDRVLGAAGAVADAGAVRDLAEAGDGGPRPRPPRRVRLVQPRAGLQPRAATRARCRVRSSAPAG